MILNISEHELRQLSAEFFELKSKVPDEVAINLVAFFATDEELYHQMVRDYNPEMKAFVREFLDWAVPIIRQRKIQKLFSAEN